MTGVYNGVIPCILETAIRCVVSEQEFPDNCIIDIENLDGENQMLNSAFSVIVESDDKYLSLFVKCLQDNVDNSFVAESRIFFNNEVVFYGELLEAFKQLCHNFPECMYKAAPICFKSFQDDEISYIIMENLFHYGYQDIEATKPLQLNHAHLVLQELGKLHALSYVMKDQQPLKFANIVDKIEETLFREDMRSTFGKLFVHAIHDALKLAKHSLPPRSLYTEKLSDFTLNVFDRMTLLAQGDAEDEEYKVVTHGDLRNGNILIRYEDEVGGGGTPAGICLLDYQACRYSSPAHDLSFFLFVCVDKSTRDQHRDALIHTYHNTLCSTIEQLGSDPIHIFPMSALHRQLRKHARFALGLALAGLPMYMDEGAEPSDEGDGQHELLESDEVLHVARQARDRKSMKCKNKMMEIIIDAVDQGWL